MTVQVDVSKLEIGDELPPITLHMTQDKMDRYGHVAGGGNPLHYDPEWAKNSEFGGTIAGGVQVLAYFNQAVTRAFPKAWIESGEIEVAFIGPTKDGDSVISTARLVEKARENGKTRLTFDVVCTNQKGQKFSSTLLRYARNRRCMTLDLASASGKDVFKRLVKVSDIVIENFAPTTMTELGLGYDVLKEVNPRIIYGSISGFGHLDILPGPFYKRAAFNSIAQAMGGLADATGELGGSPIQAQAPIGDVFPGTLCTVGILQALYQRERTGLGQHVDVAMYDAMVSMLTMRLQDYVVTGALLERGAKRSSAPNGFFKVKDGYVAIATVGEPMWERFCKAVGKPELVGSHGLERGTDRARNLDTILRPIIEGWAADK